MIKAQDLRPGNIIRHTVHGVITIEGVWSQKVKDGNYETVYHNKEWHLLGHCKPVELTPDLLGKIKGCNLTLDGKHTTKWGISDGNRYIGVAYYKGDKKWSAAWGDEIILEQPTFHWLQNVIYYNWGKELEITL